MREKTLENQVKRFLESKGIYRLGTDVKKKQVPAIGYYTKRHGSVFTGSGLPDMQIVIHGRCFEVELKNETGKTSPMQDFIIDQILKSDGCGMVVNPKNFETFKTFIEERI